MHFHNLIGRQYNKFILCNSILHDIKLLSSIFFLKFQFCSILAVNVSGHYIDKIREMESIPLTVRSDLGGENVHLQAIQTDLRTRFFVSNRPSFLTGRSTANQRIDFGRKLAVSLPIHKKI